MSEKYKPSPEELKIDSYLDYALHNLLEYDQIELRDDESLIKMADQLEEAAKTEKDDLRKRMLIENCLRISDHLCKKNNEYEIKQDRGERILGKKLRDSRHDTEKRYKSLNQ